MEREKRRINQRTMTTMSKIITIKSCSECQYTNEHEDFCTEAEKVICNLYIIPDWCPLPDKEGDKESDNNEMC